METNRIYKENYSLRPSTIFKNGWSLGTRKVAENKHVVELFTDEESLPLVIENSKGERYEFESNQKAQDFINQNIPFQVNSELRRAIVARKRAKEVLTYTIEDGYILGTWNLEKPNSAFLIVGEVEPCKKYVDLKAIEGKTLGEVLVTYDDWLESAYDDSMGSYADSYFNLVAKSVDDCSCQGKGCPTCSPRDFL